MLAIRLRDDDDDYFLKVQFSNAWWNLELLQKKSI